MNPTGQSQFNQARIEWAIRLRYSPMPELNTKLVAANLNAFRIGELEGDREDLGSDDGAGRGIGGERGQEGWGPSRAGVEGGVGRERGGGRARGGAEVFLRASAGDAGAGPGFGRRGERAALPDGERAFVLLQRARDSAADRQRGGAGSDGGIPADAGWFFESRRGYLGYLQHIFDVYGQPCAQGEWLTCVGSGWMRPLSIAFIFKNFPLRDWMLFCSRYGGGFLEGITDAQKNDPAWEEAREALEKMANDGVVLHNRSVALKFLETPAKSALPFEALVEHVNRLYAKCYRGIDLDDQAKRAQIDGFAIRLGRLYPLLRTSFWFHRKTGIPRAKIAASTMLRNPS